MSEQEVNQREILYPGETWLQYISSEEAGYSSEQLAKVQDYCNQIGSAALLVVHNGAILLAWGEIKRRFMCLSIRKSYLSALYGIYVGNGTVDLDKSLADLNIDDEPPLTAEEKEAQVRDLLKSRSGIYHPAAYEGQAEKPARGSHKPGSHWFYNNWDFNTLLTIFEQETGTRFFEEFKRQIADSLQMEEFRLEDTYYHLEKDRSIHPAYPFRMSAKDMARFGLLYLRRGRWRDQQVIPATWVTESTTNYSEVGVDGYGYMWWIIDSSHPRHRLFELETYMASGNEGQVIVIIPRANLAVVHLTDAYQWREFDYKQIWTVLDMILDAREGTPVPDPELRPFQDPSEQFEGITLGASTLDKYVGQYTFDTGMKVSVSREDDTLIISSSPIWPYSSPTYLLPVSETKFILEDIEYSLIFDLDNNDHQIAVEVTPDDISFGELIRS
ncbi:MAG: serine hydrolase [Chloroflexi bacterium]|nr:serine hydrolase [Chloroflexota bacterium]